MALSPKRCLLVVDDEDDLRSLLSQFLNAEGYDTVTASDGAEAIQILEKQTFDAALLDILMPNQNGITVLKHITKNYPSTKSIILTGHADLHRATEARQNGAMDFITKPYKIETVLAALERALQT